MGERMDERVNQPTGQSWGVTEKMPQPHHVLCTHEIRELDVFSFLTVEALGVLRAALFLGPVTPTQGCALGKPPLPSPLHPPTPHKVPRLEMSVNGCVTVRISI